MKIDAVIPRRRARVEMIPLIDCVFILLVFFIYSMLAMTMQRGIVVQLPETTTLEAATDEAVVVTITAQGGLLVDKQRVSLDGVGPAVQNALTAMADPRVVINADAGSEHRWFVGVVDELRRRGITRVVIMSEAKPVAKPAETPDP